MRCLLLLILLPLTAFATSPYDHLETDASALEFDLKVIFARALFLGVDHLSAEERARLVIEPRENGLRKVFIAEGPYRLFTILEPPEGAAIRSDDGEDWRRVAIGRALVLTTIFDYSESSGPPNLNSRGVDAIGDVLAEIRRVSPERRRFVSPELPLQIHRYLALRSARGGLKVYSRVIETMTDASWLIGDCPRLSQPPPGITDFLSQLSLSLDADYVHEATAVTLYGIIRNFVLSPKAEANLNEFERGQLPSVLVALAPLVFRYWDGRVLTRNHEREFVKAERLLRDLLTQLEAIKLAPQRETAARRVEPTIALLRQAGNAIADTKSFKAASGLDCAVLLEPSAPHATRERRVPVTR